MAKKGAYLFPALAVLTLMLPHFGPSSDVNTAFPMASDTQKRVIFGGGLASSDVRSG